MDDKALRKIQRECRKLARELTKERYKLYDEIWNDRIRISKELYAHGRNAVHEINLKMPNLITHDWTRSTLDVIAERYNFETTSDLVDYLLAYRPRGQIEEVMYEQLLQERLAENMEPVYDVDDVPF